MDRRSAFLRLCHINEGHWVGTAILEPVIYHPFPLTPMVVPALNDLGTGIVPLMWLSSPGQSARV